MPFRLSLATWLILLYKSKIWLQQHLTSTHAFVMICEVMRVVGEKNVRQWSWTSHPVQTLFISYLHNTASIYNIYSNIYYTLLRAVHYRFLVISVSMWHSSMLHFKTYLFEANATKSGTTSSALPSAASLSSPSHPGNNPCRHLLTVDWSATQEGNMFTVSLNHTVTLKVVVNCSRNPYFKSHSTLLSFLGLPSTLQCLRQLTNIC